jgi:hypothetical protein
MRYGLSREATPVLHEESKGVKLGRELKDPKRWLQNSGTELLVMLRDSHVKI